MGHARNMGNIAKKNVFMTHILGLLPKNMGNITLNTPEITDTICFFK